MLLCQLSVRHILLFQGCVTAAALKWWNASPFPFLFEKMLACASASAPYPFSKSVFLSIFAFSIYLFLPLRSVFLPSLSTSIALSGCRISRDSSPVSSRAGANSPQSRDWDYATLLTCRHIHTRTYRVYSIIRVLPFVRELSALFLRVNLRDRWRGFFLCA